ncbi:hypothetical protein AA958_04250 [Streptomyces sp. CNQ-509]|uniref:helix-turn-helix transcriptional regulator n=1 Tax=unclassified Streptomyces TaxID=2593676 RepID=UPI00062E0265|nr:helix-turn-helix transcriptional regulator [Streptomyces sp. CNQ-509]AKH81533.1 hypothetical protein AA958_04250 [Streptomyces sp. CNQ-509]
MELHGRVYELSVMYGRLHRMRHEQSGLILLNGPKGCGKTVLLDRITDTARRAGFDVVNGRMAHRKKLLLAASFGFLAFSSPDQPDNPASGPDLLEEALGAELPAHGRTAARPVLVALDDVSWGDPHVQAALRGLPAALPTRPVLWLLSGTGGPAPHVPIQHPDAVGLALGPLNGRDALRMAAERLGGAPDELIQRLVAACGGHPALLGAVLDELVADGGCRVCGRVAALVPAMLPPRVVTALLRTDPRLSGPARDLLHAVAARRLPPRMSELLRLPASQAVSTLASAQEATEAGVLVLDGDRLHFRHPLLQQAAELLHYERPAARAGELLSPTEEAVTRLVAAGLTNRQIASRINLSPHTVNFHLRKIFQKLGVSSRVELVGARLHLLDPASDAGHPPPAPESRPAHAG